MPTSSLPGENFPPSASAGGSSYRGEGSSGSSTARPMELPQPDANPPESPVRLAASPSRALIRDLGPTAWTVLVDVVLDGRWEGSSWAARTSVRAVADHLGVTQIGRASCRERV